MWPETPPPMWTREILQRLPYFSTSGTELPKLELPPGLVWKWKTRSCCSQTSKHSSAIAVVSSSQVLGSGLPPSRNVVLSATTLDSAACFKALRVISALRGKNETQIAPRMRSLDVEASSTTSLRSKDSSWIGTP